MLIYIIRHGRTELGDARRYQGVTDGPLSAAGRAGLRRADFAPERVYVTSLRRTAETAAILFPGAERVAVPGLREMDFGAFEGRNYSEMEHDPAYRAWVEGGCVGKCPGGEDRAGFSARVRAAFAALVEDSLSAGAARLVIVAHGGSQMAVLAAWGRPARDYYAWQTKPGGGYLLDASGWPGGLDVLEEVDFTV